MATYALELEQQYFSAEFIAKDDEWTARYESWNCQRTLRRLPQSHTSGRNRLLEIGIGSGRFLNAAAKSGWQVAGIDASAAVIGQARQRYGIPLFAGCLDDYDHSLGEYFDVVVMNHVLEHIADPKKALLQVRSLLKADGVLHLAVPNFNCWEAHFSGWTSYQPYHLYYFDCDSLTYLFHDCGFKIQNVSSQEPFSGWINTIVHTALGTHRIEAAQSPVEVINRLRSGKVNALLRDGFEVTRLAVGGLLLPLRMAQCSIGRGEELVMLASPLEGG